MVFVCLSTVCGSNTEELLNRLQRILAQEWPHCIHSDIGIFLFQYTIFHFQDGGSISDVTTCQICTFYSLN